MIAAADPARVLLARLQCWLAEELDGLEGPELLGQLVAALPRWRWEAERIQAGAHRFAEGQRVRVKRRRHVNRSLHGWTGTVAKPGSDPQWHDDNPRLVWVHFDRKCHGQWLPIAAEDLEPITRARRPSSNGEHRRASSNGHASKKGDRK
jgi:hypothetical protein